MGAFCAWSTDTSPCSNTKEEKDFEKIITKGDEKSIKKISNLHKNSKLKAKNEILDFLATVKENEAIIFRESTYNKPLVTKKPSQLPKNFRGSKFRGVSANGKSWQVYIVIDKVKRYAGWVKTQLAAAALYDKLAIIFHSLEAKTNFSYSKQDVLNIISWKAGAN